MKPEDIKLANETLSAVNEENQELEKRQWHSRISQSVNGKKELITTRVDT